MKNIAAPGLRSQPLFPIVRAEWRRGQAGAVVEIAAGEIFPRITRRCWLRHCAAGNDDLVAFNACRGWLPLSVLAGDDEALELAILRDEAAIGVGETEHDFAATNLAASWQRARSGRNLFPVNPAKCPESKTAADFLFVLGMDVLRLADVDVDAHAGLGQRERLEHRLAYQRPVARGAAVEVRQLRPGERKLVTPARAPVGHEQRELGVINHCLRRRAVRLALIPERAADGVWDERRDLAVEKSADVALARANVRRVLWLARERLLFGAGGFHVLLPFREVLFVFRLLRGFVDARAVLRRRLEVRLQFRRLLLRLGRDPRFDGRAADGRVDQANRDAERLVNL